MIGNAGLSQLLVACVLHHSGIWSQNVVQSAESGVVGLAGAIVVAKRLRILDTLAGLIIVLGKEIEERPATALVVNASTNCGIDQCIR